MDESDQLTIDTIQAMIDDPHQKHKNWCQHLMERFTWLIKDNEIQRNERKALDDQVIKDGDTIEQQECLLQEQEEKIAMLESWIENLEMQMPAQ